MDSVFSEKIKGLTGNELKNAYMEERKYQTILMVCRQTNYSEEEVRIKLEKNGYNHVAILKEYMNPDNKRRETTRASRTSTNQIIYGEIRDMMEHRNRNMERKQQLKDNQEQRKQQQEQWHNRREQWQQSEPVNNKLPAQTSGKFGIYRAALGVEEGATAREITQAYNRKIREYHTDKVGDHDWATEQTQFINQAKAVLLQELDEDT
jgi:hypothetical protein